MQADYVTHILFDSLLYFYRPKAISDRSLEIEELLVLCISFKVITVLTDLPLCLPVSLKWKQFFGKSILLKTGLKR